MIRRALDAGVEFLDENGSTREIIGTHAQYDTIDALTVPQY